MPSCLYAMEFDTCAIENGHLSRCKHIFPFLNAILLPSPNLLIFPAVNFLPREDLFCVNCRVARPGNLLKNAGKSCLFFLPSSVSSLCHFEISFAKKKLFFLLFFPPPVFAPVCTCHQGRTVQLKKLTFSYFSTLTVPLFFFLAVLERIKKVPLGLSSKLLYIFFCCTSASACPSFTLNMANEYSGKFYEEEVFCLSKLNERL